MAWKYPKRPIKGTHVIDIDAINRNFLTVAEETTGFLNEHNFKGIQLGTDQELLRVDYPEQLISTRMGTGSDSKDKLPEDIGYRLHYAVAQGRDPANTQGTNWSELDGTDFLQTIDETGFRITATFQGSFVWICASFTLHNHKIPAYFSQTSFAAGSAGKKGFGFNVGLLVDGALVPESLVGTGDVTQENFIDEDHQPVGGGGINGARNAVTVDAVVYVPPGQHTIEIGVQDIRGSNYEVVNNNVAISTCELFALEMMR